MSTIQVGIVMGSKSDLEIMTQAKDALKEFGIESELAILSAHRTPELAFKYAKTARERGLKVIIGGAGGSAHLPGVLAGLSTLPVIGVPVNASISIDGWDSLLSIVQMPPGVPVATVAVDAGRNAGILAAQIIGVSDADVAKKLDEFKLNMGKKVIESHESVNEGSFKVR